jgi:hypothetical protein
MYPYVFSMMRALSRFPRKQKAATNAICDSSPIEQCDHHDSPGISSESRIDMQHSDTAHFFERDTLSAGAIQGMMSRDTVA